MTEEQSHSSRDETHYPVTTPVTNTATPSAAIGAVANSPGILVLQWLTYAFWGWTALSLIWLTYQSISFFVDRSNYGSYGGETVAYSLAAVIVLFIISLICDVIYAKYEPVRKQGAAMVIMIIHAVIFALFGIGSLIVAVFAVVNLLIGNDSAGPITVLITGLIMAVVYGATLLRTLRPFGWRRVSMLYGLFMAVVAIAVTVLGISGPTLFAAQTKNDRLIESGLGSVSDTINNYARDNDKLPSNLTTIASNTTPDGQTLIGKNLVEYTPGKTVMISTNMPELPEPKSPSISVPIAVNPSKTFEYTLCVTFKEKSAHSDAYPATYTKSSRGRVTTPETYNHPAGRVCYDLVTEYAYPIY